MNIPILTDTQNEYIGCMVFYIYLMHMKVGAKAANIMLLLIIKNDQISLTWEKQRWQVECR